MLTTPALPGPPPGLGLYWPILPPAFQNRSSLLQPLVPPRLAALPDSPTCLSLKLVSQPLCILSDWTRPTGFFALLVLGEENNIYVLEANPGSKSLGMGFKQPLGILSVTPVSWHFRATQLLKQVVNRNSSKPSGGKGGACAPGSSVCGADCRPWRPVLIDWLLNLARRKMGIIIVPTWQAALPLAHPFVHSFSKYLLSTCYPFLQTKGIQKSPEQSLCPHEVYNPAQFTSRIE